MKKLSILLLISCLVLSCENLEIPNDLPSCIENQIKSEVLNREVRTPNKASVHAYMFNGEKIYIFDPGSGYADWLFTAFNDQCEVICESGGIAGLNTCPNFNETAEYLGVVWEDPR